MILNMKFLQKIFKHPNFWPIVVVLFFTFLATRTLFTSGYFNMHDDLQMMRQLEMEKCFLDLQIPCRWVPDMGYGFGFPLFNFYPPLPYLIGQVIRLVGFSFVDTVKLVFALSFFISGIGMYLLAKEFFGKWGGVFSAIFYVWAPYHSVDVYVRGAMNEAWALTWFPFILWTAYKFIKEKEGVKKFLLPLAFSWFALLTSHNLMVLIFTPLFALWCLIFLWREKAWKKIPQLIIPGVLAFGLAAFFTLPSILEQKYVQVSTLIVGYYDYTAHYVSLGQLLLSRFWGFGASVWGLEDKMPFQIGHLHWILSLIIVGWAGFILIKKRKLENSLLVIILMVLAGWFALFMAHSRSIFIWQALPFLRFVQFPWRFLTLATLGFSFAVGALIYFLKEKVVIAKIVLIVLALTLVLINWKYFLPEHGKMGPLTDTEKFTGAAWELQQTAGIYDYLPVWAKEAPKGPQKELGEIMDGEGVIAEEKQGTNWGEFKTIVSSDTALIRINIFKFPNWKVYVDGQEVSYNVPETEKWGRMYIEVPKGAHEVNFKLYNTFVRSLANSISFLTWLGLIIYLIIKGRKQN